MRLNERFRASVSAAEAAAVQRLLNVQAHTLQVPGLCAGNFKQRPEALT